MSWLQIADEHQREYNNERLTCSVPLRASRSVRFNTHTVECTTDNLVAG